MNKSELRAQAIEVMAEGIYGKGWINETPGEKMLWRAYAERSLMALGKIKFHVLGPQVSADMIGTTQSCHEEGMSISRTFLAMVKVGDLTKNS